MVTGRFYTGRKDVFTGNTIYLQHVVYAVQLLRNYINHKIRLQGRLSLDISDIDSDILQHCLLVCIFYNIVSGTSSRRPGWNARNKLFGKENRLF